VIASILKVNFTVAQFFGGTSVLILVGVLLDIMRQAETHLIQRHYDGFLRKGKIRGRYDRRTGTGKTASKNTMIWLYTIIAVIVIIAVAYMFSKRFG
jgi:preprotein translocase subunit SecY